METRPAVAVLPLFDAARVFRSQLRYALSPVHLAERWLPAPTDPLS